MRVPDPALPIWIDGAWHEPDASRPAWLGPSIQSGVGAFETLAVHDAVPIDRSAHLRRLDESAAALEVELPDRGALVSAIDRLAARMASPFGWLKIVAFRSGPTAVFGGAVDPAEIGRPCRAVVLPWVRHSNDPLAGLKCTSWAAAVRGEAYARRQGVTDGIWLNQRGHLVEACSANLFFVQSNKLFTAGGRDGAFLGIVRGHVLEAARELGLAVHVGKVRRGRLRKVHEAFLTSSVRGIRPLLEVDGRSIGNGEPGPVTRSIAAHVDGLRVCEVGMSATLDSAGTNS